MMKKLCWMAAVAALVMASTVSLWRQRLQLAASDLRCRQLESALFAATNKVAAISKGKAAAVTSPGAAAAATNAVPQCLGYEVTDDDDSGVRLRLYFSKEPDLAAIGLYVKFSPGVEGLRSAPASPRPGGDVTRGVITSSSAVTVSRTEPTTP